MALYGSRHALHRINVRSAYAAIPHPATGIPDPRTATKEIVAEFGVAGAEYSYLNPETGRVETGADISGFFFDSEEAAKREGWTEEEHEMVIAIVDDWCAKTPSSVWKIERVHVAAPLPWPTYADASAEEAVEFAVRLHLVPETLRYERENLERQDVIQALENQLAGLPEDEQGRAAPVEDYPEGAFDVKKDDGPAGPMLAAPPDFNQYGAVRGGEVKV